MPFIRPKKRGSPPHPKLDRQDQSPIGAFPEWGGTDLPDLKNPDILPNIFGGRLEGNWSKVADPLDCEAWPSSIYCDPVSTFNPGKFFDVGVSISANLCGVSVEVNPTLAWISMPPSIVTWRSGAAECQPEPPVMDLPLRTGATFYRQLYGHFGCMYRARARIYYPSEISEEWAFDETYFDFWGPFEGYSLYEIPMQTNQGLIYSLSPVFYAHGNADYYPNYFLDPRFPDLRPTTQIVRVHARGTAQAFTVEHEMEIDFWEINEAMPDREITNAMGSKLAYNRAYCKQAPPVPLLPVLEDPNVCNCKAIEADLKAIKQFLGVSSGGWSVPAKIRGLGTDQVPIDNMAQLWGWYLTQFSEMIGDTQIKIKVTDTDLVADGNQEKELVFDNLSQAITELLGLALNNAATQGAIYRTAAQGLLQAGQATIAASQAALNIDEIIDFLAYGAQDKEEEITLFFTPGEDKPEDFLDTSTQKLTFREMKDKQTFQTFAKKMLLMASIYQSLNTINPDSPDFAALEDGMRKNAKSTDLDTFIRDAEQGFQGAAGNPDATRPYGEEYSKRPRIKKLKGDGTDDGGP